MIEANVKRGALWRPWKAHHRARTAGCSLYGVVGANERRTFVSTPSEVVRAGWVGKA